MTIAVVIERFRQWIARAWNQVLFWTDAVFVKIATHDRVRIIRIIGKLRFERRKFRRQCREWQLGWKCPTGDFSAIERWSQDDLPNPRQLRVRGHVGSTSLWWAPPSGCRHDCAIRNHARGG